MLKGNLSSFSLGEIFQSLAINKHTGTLTISTGSDPKHIYFENGNIRFFSHGTPRTPRIGELLMRSGRITRPELEESLAISRETGRLLGRVLLERKLITEKDVVETLQQKICEEIYELFSWTHGEFEVHLDHCPDDVFDALQKSVKITINTNSVIMEGLRRIDEWQMIRNVIRTDNEIFAIVDRSLIPEDLEDVVDGLDSRTPIRVLAEASAIPRFDFLKGLYDLLEDGAIRPLTVHELRQFSREALEDRNISEAAAYLRFACELERDAELFTQLGDVLSQFYQEREAQQAYLGALTVRVECGEWEAAAKLAERLPPNAEFEIDELDMLLRVFVELRQSKKALWAGQQLSAKLHSTGESDRANEVLDLLVDLDPSDLNIKVQIASLFQQAGETRRALVLLEEVSESLEETKKIKDQIKILRLILELDPTRIELRQKISALAALQEKLERRRKQRLTIAGVTGILLVGSSFIPVIYELKARELFQHAARMEQISMSTGDFSQSRRIYEELLHEYSLSTRANDAKLALERIDTIKRSLEATAKYQQENEWQRREEERKEVDRQALAVVERAAAAEAAGDFDTAHDLYEEAVALRDQALSQIVIKFPIRVSSSPTGAKVYVGSEQIGTTPFVYRYEPGASVDFLFVRDGCQDTEQHAVLKRQKSLYVELPRRAMTEIVLPSNFEQPALRASNDGLFVFPSRDGYIYAYDVRTGGVVWQKRVGTFGDRLSNVHAHNGWVYVGTVNHALLAFHHRTGELKWPKLRVRGPILAAPATSLDDRWLAVANIHGDVYVVDNSRGEVAGRFSAENEVVAAPIIEQGMVLAGSRDHFVYAFDLNSMKIRRMYELDGEIHCDPARAGSDVLFATATGGLHCIDVANRRIRWSTKLGESAVTSMVGSPETAWVAQSSGALVSVRVSDGTLIERYDTEGSVPGGLALYGDTLYMGYADGRLLAWHKSERRPSWSWQADASISTPPLIIDDKLFVACNSGTVQILELLE